MKAEEEFNDTTNMNQSLPRLDSCNHQDGRMFFSHDLENDQQIEGK